MTKTFQLQGARLRFVVSFADGFCILTCNGSTFRLVFDNYLIVLLVFILSLPGAQISTISLQMKKNLETAHAIFQANAAKNMHTSGEK